MKDDTSTDIEGQLGKPVHYLSQEFPGYQEPTDPERLREHVQKLIDAGEVLYKWHYPDCRSMTQIELAKRLGLASDYMPMTTWTEIVIAASKALASTPEKGELDETNV